MLKRLRVKEYALIDEVIVEFGAGLNVLTGETGAGKSILVDSLELLTGARAYTDDIREGAEHATVEGVFEVDGVETVVRREIFRDRSNRCYLDGNLATAKMLQERGEAWVEIHGQHDDHLLLKRSQQRAVLDAFAGADDLVERVAGIADAMRALERERAELERAEAERASRIDWLRSQVDEIDAAELDPDEPDRLEVEAKRLRNAAERQRLAGGVWERLEGADESALAPALAGVERQLERLVELDPDLEAARERLASARYEIEDIAHELLGYAESVEHDPARLAGLEERRDLLFRLERKHGGRIADVIERGEAMREELEALEAKTERAASLDREIDERRAELAELAGALADARETAADRLEGAVRERLSALGMGDGTFHVALSRRPDPEGIPWGGDRWGWSRAGLEEVEFRIAPNPGESPRPLTQIASGGELSRTLLALEAALAEAGRVPTLIFDEIDAGIGGVVAHRVAKELEAVARHHQVVVVTHLAQIAALADRHLVVEKSPRGDRTVTSVRDVGGDERIREVSRLLGGDPERDVSRHHAEELLGSRR